MTDRFHDVKTFIELTKERHKEVDFMHGGCYLLFEKLQERYPEAIAMYGGNGHVLTLLYGRLWDATGMVYYPLVAEPRIAAQAPQWVTQQVDVQAAQRRARAEDDGVYYE